VKRVHRTVGLPAEQAEKVRALAVKNGVSISYILEYAVQHYFGLTYTGKSANAPYFAQSKKKLHFSRRKMLFYGEKSIDWFFLGRWL
jgi:hypothetical protein